MNIGPNWSRAPSWAKFAAMDSHGAWHWYEAEPVLAESMGMWTARGACFSVAAITLTDWQATLHARGEEWPKPKREVPTAEGLGGTNVTLGHLFIRMTAQGIATGGPLKNWIDAGWSADQLVADGYAERLAG